MNIISEQFLEIGAPLFDEGTNICVEFLHMLNDEKELPFVFQNIGSWWNRKSNEIDIVVLNDEDILLFTLDDLSK